MRFQGGVTWHASHIGGDGARWPLLCGIGLYNKASFVQPLRTRLDAMQPPAAAPPVAAPPTREETFRVYDLTGEFLASLRDEGLLGSDSDGDSGLLFCNLFTMSLSL